jgi:Kef-type K+ transport system membrane component KefB
MTLFFIMIAVMLALELELALGAFIAGIAISAFFHHEKQLEEKMSSLGFGFLVPLFFIHVGASFDLKALLLEGVVSGALLITVLMIFSRLFAAIVLRSISGSRDALLIALSLSMPLTLLVAVATIGYETKLLDLLTYYQLILASIFEILISMTIIKVLQTKKRLPKNRRRKSWKHSRSKSRWRGSRSMPKSRSSTRVTSMTSKRSKSTRNPLNLFLS